MKKQYSSRALDPNRKPLIPKKAAMDKQQRIIDFVRGVCCTCSGQREDYRVHNLEWRIDSINDGFGIWWGETV